MDIYKVIIESLKKEYDAGATYQELAKKYDVSYPYLRALLLGVKPVHRMSLEFFFKLFPRASVNISGGITAPVINNGHNNGVMNGVNHGLSEAMDKILAAETLTDEEKIKVLKVLKK